LWQAVDIEGEVFVFLLQPPKYKRATIKLMLQYKNLVSH